MIVVRHRDEDGVHQPTVHQGCGGIEPGHRRIHILLRPLQTGGIDVRHRRDRHLRAQAVTDVADVPGAHVADADNPQLNGVHK